ncbi:4Fe-4S dicluster domain-containing protein [Polluticaenibacter yanchengensis]|uniref:(Fe-S)-binding protein n=1 Tax=Polluticaenibacter yanchengensis TaxID=3014562 RepID=A0ABT4UMM1_9BACT|nr:(Fe-S)-binding protein [Chitinophagaceae bacterium LY-5]
MLIVTQILFVVLLAISVFLFARQVKFIRRNILLGKKEEITSDAGERMRNVILLAFGQKKMFKKPLVGFLHFLVYAGFLIINVEMLEIVLDGILGTHRIFSPALGGFYPILINAFEILAFLVLVACVIFLIRRNIVKLKRFISKDLDGWPRSDANYILITEIVLMSLFLIMNATDTLLQSRGYGHYGEHLTGNFAISQFLHPVFNSMSDGTLVAIERSAWWIHIVGILAFLNYLPYSKHLHIVLGFPNTYYTRTDNTGKMINMPEIQKEVMLAMGADIQANPVLAQLPDEPPTQFGAKDVFDLSWKNLMDAYSCTECGRCSAACPANITGKALSPRTIMMKTRDRLTEVGKHMDAHNGNWEDDGKSLLHNYITVEELRACTTCNACVEACPISISPLDIILKQRRYLILDESNSPNEWNVMFGNIENNFAPWKFNPTEREAWIQ